ncbi:MAG: flagellar biosynthesis anti-sigma factor FlgM [Burkholderiaceae bacterium]|nr:flagellar biosynthesis anti-sigma factor FlgM [Burkholderiaceae bacterium]
MKIGQKPELQGALAQAAPAKQQAKAAPQVAGGVAASASSAAAAAAGVPVTFSSAAKALDQISRNQGDFDAGKVKAVRSAIENGTFKVDAEVVADKMLANTQEFIARARG